MKRVAQSVMFILVAAILCGCNSFQINGIENFNENDCCFGLNVSLMPNGHDFLSTYQYEEGNYQYWRNNYGQAHAKTYIYLQYSDAIYQKAKLACQEFFTFSEESCSYESFVFYGVNIEGGDTSLNPAYPGFRMLGFNDDRCALVFIGYLNDAYEPDSISAISFEKFFEEQFSNFL